MKKFINFWSNAKRKSKSDNEKELQVCLQILKSVNLDSEPNKAKFKSLTNNTNIWLLRDILNSLKEARQLSIESLTLIFELPPKGLTFNTKINLKIINEIDEKDKKIFTDVAILHNGYVLSPKEIENFKLIMSNDKSEFEKIIDCLRKLVIHDGLSVNCPTILIKTLLSNIDLYPETKNILKNSTENKDNTEQLKILSDSINNLIDNNLFNNHKNIKYILDCNKKGIFSKNSAEMLDSLNKANLLENNRSILEENKFEISHMNSIIVIVDALRISRLATQENFEKLLKNLNNLSDPRLFNIFNRIPSHKLKQDVFNEIINRCHAGYGSVNAYINNLLGIGIEKEINPNQSVHVKSVEESIAKVALELKKQYPQALENKNNILTEIKAWIENFNSETMKEKIEPAKKLINNVITKYINYKDENIGLDLQDALVLTWTTAHDETTLKCTIQDAEFSLINSFYEIQRNYNLDITNKDNGNEDVPSCNEGKFEMFIGALWGIHEKVEIVYANKATASAKLPIIVREEVIDYFIKNRTGDTLIYEELNEKYKELKYLLKNEADLGEVWAKIRPNVQSRVRDEFQVVFREIRKRI